MEAKYVAATIQVPMQRTDFAFDMNGEGQPDNQLGNFIGALEAQNLDTQLAVTQSLQSGSALLLLALSAANLDNDSCAGVTTSVGLMPATPPKFDGTDTFTVDPLLDAGHFSGPIDGRHLASIAPNTATAQTEVQLVLPLPLMFPRRSIFRCTAAASSSRGRPAD
jgi:hypothetical protein